MLFLVLLELELFVLLLTLGVELLFVPLFIVVARFVVFVVGRFVVLTEERFVVFVLVPEFIVVVVVVERFVVVALEVFEDVVGRLDDVVVFLSERLLTEGLADDTLFTDVAGRLFLI